MSKKITYVDVNYTCPICGKPINRVKITKEYIRCFNKDKVDYQLEFNCNCFKDIYKIVNWNNEVKEDFSEINILNIFANAQNKAFEQALKSVGIEEE